MRRQREITLHYLLIRYTHAHIYFIIAPLSTHWLYLTITYIFRRPTRRFDVPGHKKICHYSYS